MGSWIFKLGTQRRALGWPGVQGSLGDMRGKHTGGAEEERTDEQAQILRTLLPPYAALPLLRTPPVPEDTERWQHMLPQNMPLCHKDHFVLKALENSSCTKGIWISPFLPEDKR